MLRILIILCFAMSFTVSCYGETTSPTNMKQIDSSLVEATAPQSQKTPAYNPIIIFGSSRSDGNTLQAIKLVIKNQPVPVIDLRGLNISDYDYDSMNASDDFIPLAEKMMEHNPIILATPVYWYSMSAVMKTFIDRWTDLLSIRKDLGRRLANKDLYIITSYGSSMPKGFEDPFSQTSDYFDMHYKGCFYFYSGKDTKQARENQLSAEKFHEQIFLPK